MKSEIERAAAQAFLSALFACFKAARRRGIDTGDGRAALNRLRSACDPLLDDSSRLELRVARQTLHLNGEHLVSDIENFVFYRNVVETLTRAGIGRLELTGLPTQRDLGVLIGLVARVADPEPVAENTEKIVRGIAAQGVRGIAVQSTLQAGTDLLASEEMRAAARRTYEQSVAASRELFNGTRMGRAANVTQVKQAVQSIVDGVLDDETSLGGLSTLKDYDDYAFTHAVNVCIFCVAIGRRLGLSKLQLYDLGHAALVHDIGMSRIPRGILTKGSALTEAEQRQMQAHTWLGALAIFELRDFGEIPLQSMMVAYEHHLKPDGAGYPPVLRAREPSIFSKIVAVAAAFDAATNERSYSDARPADEVLRELWEDKTLGYDPVIVKALINLLGIYPVGTVVILDTYELAVVHAANPDPSFVHRPVVRLLCDANGRWLEPPPLFDLATVGEDGSHERSIIKVTDADRYGIRVADYFA